MDYTKEEKKVMISVLKERDFKKAFLSITECNWWANHTITNDMERENFLYRKYFDYHHLIFVEGIKEIEVEEGYKLMNHLKIQLDDELRKVKKGIYESEEE
ncbi:hypothetical protein CVD28_02950 [Bacillus sp. M6-12]|uniref:hypothetical protein n=1 Tax=Bacillus sp. M6-12 TaxID=2054166 RepID=UPI000C782B85|nr:hypothetical protein [Bacillus sp. M6-12]PLS19389.1 hypothetical protein CVD28_02950 [Bacillus sp. M6-12]